MPDFRSSDGKTVSVEGRLYEEGHDQDRTVDHYLGDDTYRQAEWTQYFQTNTRADFDALAVARDAHREQMSSLLSTAPIDCPESFIGTRFGIPREFGLDRRARRSGPRVRGNLVDLNWVFRDPQQKEAIWAKWYDAGGEMGARDVIYDHALPVDDAQQQPQQPNQPAQPGQPAPTNPGQLRERLTTAGKALGFGTLGLSGLGALGGIIYGIIYAANNAAASATTLIVTATQGGDSLTVSWTAFTPASTTDSFTITLTSHASGVAPRVETASSTATSAVFTSVAAGTYDIKVEINGATGTLAGHVVTAVAPVMTTTHPDPTGLTLSEVPGAPGRTPAINASWTAPTGATGLEGYVVSYERLVTAPAPLETWADVAVGMATSAVVPATDPGTYKVTVVAAYAGSKRSTGISQQITITPAPNVDPPSNIVFYPYRAVSTSTKATGVAGLVIQWDLPTTGSWIDGFDVTVIATPSGMAATTKLYSVSGAGTLSLESVQSGTFNVSVASRGLGIATSAAVTANYTLDTSKIDQNAPDWSIYLSSTTRQAWIDASVTVPADDTTLWANVIAAVSDTAGTLGGVASLQEQLQLATLITNLITKPVDPSYARLDLLADWLVAAAKFPTGQLSVPGPTSDGVALWTAAQTLANPNTGTLETLRFRLLAIRQTLDRYLNGDPRVAPAAKASQRVYSLASIPVESVDIAATAAGITAQRFVFSCPGTISGVWWYRVANDKVAGTTLHNVYAWTTAKVATRNVANEGAAAFGTGNPATVAGWVYLPFTSPLTVASGDEVILGVSHPTGDHGRTYWLLAARGMTFGCVSSPMDAKVTGKGNGLYHYFTSGMATYFDTDKSAGYYISPEFIPA